MAAEIQVSATRSVSCIVVQAAKLLEEFRRVKLTAIDLAMPKLVQAVEILKYEAPTLQQLNEIEHLEGTDKTRLSIELSYSQQTTTSPLGDQAPLLSRQDSRSLHEVIQLYERGKLPWKDSALKHTGHSFDKENLGQRSPRREELSRDSKMPQTSEHGNHSQAQGDVWADRRPTDARRRRSRSYEWVNRPDLDDSKAQANEIRVKFKRPAKYMVQEGIELLKQSNFDSVVLRASGTAIPRAVEVAEGLRRSVEGLHQCSKMSCKEKSELMRSKVVGLADIESTRTVPCLVIVLSRSAMDAQHDAYEGPSCSSEVKDEVYK
jgi:DNA-binding protein